MVCELNYSSVFYAVFFKRENNLINDIQTVQNDIENDIQTVQDIYSC